MGVVKYSGPVASFHCPTEAEIRSLKVHFSPKQLGEGTPSPENIREIVGWDGVVVHNDDGVVIPEEYQKVEYLESTGTQYIQTNVIPSDAIGFDVEFFTNNPLAKNGYGCVFGSRIASQNNDLQITTFSQTGSWQGTLRFGTSNQYTALITPGIKQKVYLMNKVYTAPTGTQLNMAETSWTSTVAISLFGLMEQTSFIQSGSGCRIYYAKFYNSSTLIANFIPCRRKSDNKPGMYDTVSQTFYTNAGTGEFLYGPDVGQTTTYEFGALGKNKLSDNINDYTFLSDAQAAQATYTLSNGEFSTTVPTNTRDYLVILGKIQYPAGTYTISYDYLNGGGNTGWQPVIIQTGNTWYSSAKLTTATDSSGHFSTNFTTTKPFTVNLNLNTFGNTTQEGINKLYNLQLELGSTATTYEPYNPNHTVYGGWVNLISGEVCEEWTKEFFNGTEPWAANSDTYRFALQPSNNFPYKEYGPSNIYGDKLYLSGRNSNRYVYLVTAFAARFETVDDLKNYLIEQDSLNTPVQCVYELAIPNTYYLAPTQLQTFLGQNNVWSNADYVEVEYDLHETQTILARKQFIMANQPHIESASGAIASFTTDLAAPLKECKIHFSPVQEGSGDPSPDNVRAISGWNNINITIAGNNIIPINYTPAEGKWKPTNGVISGSVYAMGQFLVPKSKLYWSCETTGVTYVGLMDDIITAGAPTYNVVTTTNRTGYTFDNTEGHKYMLMCCNAENIINLKQMVNIGTTKTEYSAPSARTISVAFLTEAGIIYGGYVDLVSGEVWKTYGYYSNITSFTGAFGPTNNGYAVYLTFYDGDHFIKTPICDRFTYSVAGYTSMPLYSFGGSSGASITFTFILDSTITSKAEADAWLANNPISVSYGLATPKLVTTLTPTVLKTLRGTNNIWSNANGNIDVKYWTH